MSAMLRSDWLTFVYLMNAACNIVNIGWSQTTHGDAARLEQVKVFLLDEELTLSRRQTSVAEHSNLRGDVAPVTRGAKLLKPLSQTSSHVDDSDWLILLFVKPHWSLPICHGLDTVSPLFVKSWILENCVNNPDRFNCNNLV